MGMKTKHGQINHPESWGFPRASSEMISQTEMVAFIPHIVVKPLVSISFPFFFFFQKRHNALHYRRHSIQRAVSLCESTLPWALWFTQTSRTGRLVSPWISPHKVLGALKDQPLSSPISGGMISWAVCDGPSIETLESMERGPYLFKPPQWLSLF